MHTFQKQVLKIKKDVLFSYHIHFLAEIAFENSKASPICASDKRQFSKVFLLKIFLKIVRQTSFQYFMKNGTLKIETKIVIKQINSSKSGHAPKN